MKEQEEEQKKISEFLIERKKNMYELKRLIDGFGIKMDFLSQTEIKKRMMQGCD
jgi:hypothetical protein